MNFHKAINEFSKKELIELIEKNRSYQLDMMVINGISHKIKKNIDKMDELNRDFSIEKHGEWLNANKEVDRLHKIMAEDCR